MMKKSKILGFYTDVMRKKSFGSTAFRNHFGLILLSESFRGTLISERQEREPSLKKKTKKTTKKQEENKENGEATQKYSQGQNRRARKTLRTFSFLRDFLSRMISVTATIDTSHVMCSVNLVCCV